MLTKAINYWSFPGGLEDTLPLDKFFAQAKKFGFDGVEPAIGDNGPLNLGTTHEACRAIAEAVTAQGLKLESVASGLYWGRSPADADPSVRTKAISDLQQMIRITGWLGAKTLLCIPGSVDVFFLPDREKLPYQFVWEFASSAIAEALPVAEGCGVRLGIENVWNRFLMSPKEMADFVGQFGSPWVGAYVDVGNLLPFGYAEDWLRYLADKVVGVHFKDFRRGVGTVEGFVDLLEGDVNWPAVTGALEEIGYTGPVVAEMIPGYKHYPLVRIANTSNAMDAILEGGFE